MARRGQFFRLPAAALLVLVLAACAGFTPPLSHDAIGFKQRAATQTQDGLTVSAVALGPEEAQH
ncbi:MAG: hypothetical protein RLO16_16530, partial [Marinovum algicola]|uniref:hypothetical protein n=1 Tax=Marinovum algicola TaxID=42444 RepID=UPI0032EE22DB